VHLVRSVGSTYRKASRSIHAITSISTLSSSRRGTSLRSMAVGKRNLGEVCRLSTDNSCLQLYIQQLAEFQTFRWTSITMFERSEESRHVTPLSGAPWSFFALLHRHKSGL